MKNKRTNILFYILSLGEGGAQRQTINLINSIDVNKSNIYIFTREHDNSFIEHLDKRIITKTVFIHKKRKSSIVKFFIELFELFIFLLKNRIHIIYARGYPFYSKAGLLKYVFNKIKIIGVEANAFSQNIAYNNKIVKEVKYWLYRKALSKCDKIYCLTNANKVDLAETLNLEKSMIDVFPVIVDKSKINNFNSCITSYFLLNNKFNLCCIGRFVEQKNQLLGINAMSYLDDSYHLHLIGNGVLEKTYASVINNSNIEKSITIHPFKKNIYEIIFHSDIILFTSKYEGFGNILLETLILGKPIISTNFIGIDDFLSEKLMQMNLLLDDYSPRNLSEKIIEVRENYLQYKLRIEKNIDEIAERFSYKKYSKIFNDDIKSFSDY